MIASALLDPAFARELEALRHRLRVRTASGAGGDHLARRRGGSAEFQEHRAYAPGDDLRRVDWLAFARTGEPVMKLFRAEEDVVVRLFVDTSASLDIGAPSKLSVAKRIAASVAYLALADSERAQVVAATGGGARPFEPSRGRAGLPKILRELDALMSGGGTDLTRSIDEARRRATRPGMFVVLSDFMDPGAFEGAIARAAAAGHDLVLVQVLADEELTPPYQGDVTLEDAETSELVDVTFDAAARDAYLVRLEGLFATLRAGARRHRATYVRTHATEPTIDALKRIVARAVD